MKRRIGIVTIFDSSGNLGNKLQNYAVINVYSRFGLECKTLATEEKPKVTLVIKNNLRNIALRMIKREKINNPYHINRLKKFEEFNKLLNVDYSLLRGKPLDYDYYSVGSDQVWNPNFYKYDIRRKDFYLLTFCENCKKLSFSPSFSINSMPSEWRDWFSKNLQTFKVLSVREETGAKIIKDLTGRDATVLVDPTMMLDKQEWQVIAKKPQIKVPNHYLLTYYLGELSLERNTYIEQVANDNNLDIIRLETRNPTDAWYKTGPAEFIWLIEHCALLCTDSFHGSVFSVLMDVPFLVFDREDQSGDMGTRIDNLLSKLKLENRKFANQQGDEVFRRDYRHIPEILAEERMKANAYLKEALGIL